jgi:hypothetical protein
MFSPQVPLDDLAASLVSEHPAPDLKQHNVRKQNGSRTWKFWKRQPKRRLSSFPRGSNVVSLTIILCVRIPERANDGTERWD